MIFLADQAVYAGAEQLDSLTCSKGQSGSFLGSSLIPSKRRTLVPPIKPLTQTVWRAKEKRLQVLINVENVILILCVDAQIV